jgi:hypothetical protein
MNRTLIALVAFCLAMPLSAEDGFSSLEEQMTGTEFTEAGLEKLTPAELASLNAWIRRHSLGTLDAPAAAAPSAAAGQDRRGFDDEDDESPISSQLVGTFSGWDGQTVFKLANGMIWIQADKDKHFVKELRNPTVVIEKGFLTGWRLRVEGDDEDCKVRRIQ